jgi:hypothetical protein
MDAKQGRRERRARSVEQDRALAMRGGQANGFLML